jgi:hypothetical protein
MPAGAAKAAEGVGRADAASGTMAAEAAAAAAVAAAVSAAVAAAVAAEALGASRVITPSGGGWASAQSNSASAILAYQRLGRISAGLAAASPPRERQAACVRVRARARARARVRARARKG